MAYGDQLVRASLGGVDFWVEDTAETSAGRRTVVTQIPGSDDVAYEDLGRLAWGHEVKAFVLGDNAAAQARALLRVFDNAGPYPFSHPIYGPRQVVLAPGSRPRLTYTENVHRKLVVSFQLVEVTKAATVVVATSSAGALKAANTALVSAASDQLVKNWSGVGSIFNDVVSSINSLATDLQNVKRKALGPLAVVDALDDAIDDLQTAAEDLAGVPADLAASLNQILAEVFQLILEFQALVAEAYPGESATAQVETALSTAADVFDIEIEPALPFADAPHDEDLASDQRQLEILVKSLSLAGAGLLLADVTPPSVTLAAYVLQTFGDLADVLLEDEEVEADLNGAIRDMRDAVLARIDEASSELPSVRVFEPAGSVPAILVAWRVHGDPDRALEIVARNKIPNPAVIAEAIEVVDG